MMLISALPPQPIAPCVVTLVIVAASTDIVCRRIPNPIIVLGLIAALLIQGWLSGPITGGAHWLAGALTGFALLLPFYLLRGMAAGDVKLLMMIGAWLGPAMTFDIALATFVIGGVWSIAATLRRGRMKQMFVNLWRLLVNALPAGTGAGTIRYQPHESVGSLPYGVAIAAGTLGMLFAAAA